jgi:PAS domain S-box-containing protein
MLHLEDNEHDRIFVAEMLRVNGLSCHIVTVKSATDFEWELRNRKYDLILSDYSLPAFNGLSGLAMARELSPNTPFIFFSGTIGEESAVESLKKGAVDYVIKQRPHRLVPAIKQALQNVAANALLKQTEQKNRQQAELLDKATDAILVCDLNHRIVYWNRSAERIYGWMTAEVMEKDIVQVLFHGNTPPQLQEMSKAVEERGEWIGELHELAKDNRPVRVQCRTTLIRHENGQPKSLLIINTDITERKQLEEQLLRSQRLESLGVLVSGIAHDLNNTLAPVLIGVDVLRKAPAEKDNVLSMMENSAKRGADMIKQILAFARGDDAHKKSIPIEPLANEIGKTLAHTFPKNIQCEVKLSGKPWPVSGISTQLYQVLMNLCVNARDAMPHGGKLTLAVDNISMDAATAASIPDARPGNYVCVRVADTGVGISPEQMAKIFRPFYSTKAPGKGTGLGLSTSQGIIKNHGGFMTVTSKVGQGTEFKFFLPAVTEGSPTVLPEPALPRGNGESILVVDDEAVVLAVARTTLENYGYRVLSAENGLEAVTSLSENRDDVDLVITDMDMPLMGGRATATALRRIKPDIKIIVAGESEKEAEIGKKIQINGFIPKPITTAKLLSIVHDVAGKNRK